MISSSSKWKYWTPASNINLLYKIHVHLYESTKENAEPCRMLHRQCLHLLKQNSTFIWTSKYKNWEHNLKELATSNSVKQHLITVILNTKKPSKKLRWTYLRQIIFSWLYFLANAIKDGSIIPPRSLRTRWSVDSAKIHREFK